MRIAILGASGFIGRRLSDALQRRGDEILPSSLRDPSAAARICENVDVLVNLAGESVAQRWSHDVKERIRKSRVDAPRTLLDAIGSGAKKPSAYVSASAIGYYGTSLDATFTESSPPGSDFLASICVAWEREALRAGELGMRVAIVRMGLVLGAEGGALERLLPIFRMGGGGIVASGKQWYSWIHVDDVVGIYLAAIDGWSGLFNATTSQPVRNAEFTHALAHAVGRPALIPVPQFAMNMMLGEAAEIVTQGQRVLPERTLAQGYVFRQPDLSGALADILS
ncbi:MAG TPA: TIGR01777 family oxidoreductase [Candidatus Baltobacteraceae bacterium]|jgi:hypothetical protein|nr:TIGR01777 family oxidoreductase [Candidatus Baltobacteraceae bacterium]